MLFNSYLFLLIFLPGSLIAYHVLGRVGGGERARVGVLLAVSIIFYAAWDVWFLLLLGGSIVGNFALGRLLERDVAADGRWANRILAAGVILNLGLLGYFKYAHFLVGNLNELTGTDFVFERIILPLGISFFTFEQIGYLIDLRRGQRYGADFWRFAVFVSFFPRLVAGPILRYGEVGPQFGASRQGEVIEDIAVGLTMFAIGLVKKAVLADGIAPFVAPAFTAAAGGTPVDLFAAWGGALAYTCQLYFDFSGYSDMAIGAARCFGIRFPANFESPYKAANVIEFWRRWHMTLSRFLRDYLYIPLGGNRRGRSRRYANLMITMLLGGLWHGAAWTFVAWGGLHGLYLMVNHGWAAVMGDSRLGRSGAARVFGYVVTFVAVVVAWVFFRAPSFSAAATMLGGMMGLHGAVLPEGLAQALRPALHLLGIGVSEGSGSQMISTWLWVTALLGIALLLPNSQDLLRRHQPVLRESRRVAPATGGLAWALAPGWAMAAGGLAFLGLISITRLSEFLYWQF